jgi:hypothetical protein
MIRHLDKKNKCQIKDKNNKLSDNELYKSSLDKHDLCKKDNNELDKCNKQKQDNNYCDKCHKYFYNKSNLNKHLRNNICDKINEKNNIPNMIVNNTINNNQINNQININISYIKGFDEEWDVSKIDNKKRLEILLSNSKFSKILDNILQNNVNLNVILNDDNVGIVYKNEKNKYEIMKNKDIIEKSMDKVYKHLKDFYNEIINDNINDLSESSLKYELNELEKKYNNFFKLEEAKNIVKNSFSHIYNTYKEEAEEKYNKLLEDEKIYSY